MDMLIGLVVVVIVLLLVYWAVHRLAGTFGAPPQVIVIIDVLLVLVFALYVLRVFGLLGRI